MKGKPLPKALQVSAREIHDEFYEPQRLLAEAKQVGLKKTVWQPPGGKTKGKATKRR